MGFNFGFAAGGFGQGAMQGFNSARQAALEQAHLKMQMDMMHWQQQKFEEQNAVKPVDEMIGKMPYAAGTLLPLREEAAQYGKNPSGYSYAPQAKVPSASVPNPVNDEEDAQRAIAGNMLREQPLAQPPTMHGAEAWRARLGDAGEAAAQTDLDRQTMLLRNALAKVQFGIDARGDRSLRDFGARQDVLDQHLPGRAAATVDSTREGKVKTAVDMELATGPLKTQRAIDTAAGVSKATGKTMPSGLKPVDNKSRQQIADLIALRDRMESIESGLNSGDLPDTGLGLSKTNAFAEKLGGIIPGVTLDDPRLSAYYKYLEQMRLDLERSKGGVRMAASPIMLDRTSRIFANPENSPGGFAGRVHTGIADLNKVIEDEVSALRASGMDDTEIRALLAKHNLIPARDLLGGQEPGGSPQGIFKFTGTDPFSAGKKKKGKKQPGMPPSFQPENGGMPPSFRPE